MALKLDGYVRVSRVGGREGEGYISPTLQREAIASYAREIGGEIAAWSDDQDFSGGNMERPGFQEVLRRIEAGETGGVVVMRVDRFARSVADGAATVQRILDAGGVFASCHERIDPRTPEGRFMLNSFLNNGELFLNQIKAGWRAAKAKAVARGVHIGPTPVGYRRIAKGQPDASKLIPDPVYAPAVSEVFRLAAGRTLGDSALARHMTENAPRKSGREWQPQEIRRWLRSRVYLGEVHYGEFVNLEAHEPLIDWETWDRCQREPGVRRSAPSKFLLSGLARCANCRYAMGGFNHGGAKHSTAVYRCGGRCGEGPVITAARLEDFVLGEIRRHFGGVSIEGTSGGDLAELDSELAAAEAEVRVFASDLDARRLLGEAGWREALQVRVADRDAKRARLDTAAAATRVSALVRDLDDLDRHDLRDLLHGAIRHIFVRRRRGAAASERAVIVWADDPRSIDVPGPHRSGPFEPFGW